MTSTRTKQPAAPRAPKITVEQKLRWSLGDVCELCDLSPNYVRDLESRGEFPPRVLVRRGPDDDGGKQQFVPAEVRAWAEGRDWRKLVQERQGRVA